LTLLPDSLGRPRGAISGEHTAEFCFCATQEQLEVTDVLPRIGEADKSRQYGRLNLLRGWLCFFAGLRRWCRASAVSLTEQAARARWGAGRIALLTGVDAPVSTQRHSRRCGAYDDGRQADGQTLRLAAAENLLLAGAAALTAGDARLDLVLALATALLLQRSAVCGSVRNEEEPQRDEADGGQAKHHSPPF
jgi:hypothetical protein